MEADMTLGEHRAVVRAALSKHVPPQKAWAVEWGIRAISLARRKVARSATPTSVYCKEAFDSLARFECGVRVEKIPPGTVIAMAASRFHKHTEGAISATRTQENLHAFRREVEAQGKEMDKRTANIKDADPPCPECRSNDVLNYKSEQRRSADEPATVFYRCMKCGKEWAVDG